MPTINYADALRRKPPPPPPENRRREESGGKRPRPTGQRPTPSNVSKEQHQSPSPAHRGTTSAWGRPDASSTSIKKTPVILKRPKKEEAASVASKTLPTKRSKKPKPTSKMSLGDVMPKSIVSKKPKTEQPPIKQEALPMEMSSQEEFPSLMSSTAASKPSKPSIPAHAEWGKKQAPTVSAKKEKPVKNVATKLTPKKPSQATKPSATKQASQPAKKEAARSSLLDFGAKQRTDEDRGEHDLIRLLQDGKSVKKGRQRLAPRKKKFSTLKKKVLQERLEAWRKLHPEEETTTTTTTPTDPSSTKDNRSTTVCLRNFAESDEVEDDDEYEEIVDNLKELATKVGPIRDAFLNRQSGGSCPAFVWFETSSSANAACACWSGLVVGGQKLEPVMLYPKLQESVEADGNTEAWRSAALEVYSLGKDGTVDGSTSNISSSIVLRNALSKDDFEDEEHLEESLSYIRSLVEKHGIVSDFESKQDGDGGVVLVTYKGGDAVAKEAVSKLDGLVVGGSAISVSLSGEAPASDMDFVVELKNALTEDDLEDADCLQESLQDIETLAEKHGSLSTTDGGVQAVGTSVLLRYNGDPSVAMDVATKLDGTFLGGNILRASVVSPSDAKQASANTSGWVLLQNILADDDIEDEECMEESIEDVRELASRYGKVLSVTFDPNDLTRVVRIEFEGGSEVASFAAEKFNNMVLGGQTIAAIALASEKDIQGPVTSEAMLVAPQEAKQADSTPKPLYSGDKLIPERFAECKRVPKVTTSNGPRDYASLSLNEEMIPLLIEMLGELMRLQRRAIEDKNAKARRRIVMGLREVARGIRAHKVKMVVMANNVDQYGAIDEKLQEILDLAQQEDVPVIFELNKRKLGKAVGKNIKVSVVGIQSADGAYQQFKKLAALARKTK